MSKPPVKPHPEFPAVIDNSDVGAGTFEQNACIIFCAIVPVFIVARFYSRIIAKQLGIDDWAALGAFVSRSLSRCEEEDTDSPAGIRDDVQWSYFSRYVYLHHIQCCVNIMIESC
jgi:hypothetical protein